MIENHGALVQHGIEGGDTASFDPPAYDAAGRPIQLQLRSGTRMHAGRRLN